MKQQGPPLQDRLQILQEERALDDVGIAEDSENLDRLGLLQSSDLQQYHVNHVTCFLFTTDSVDCFPF